ncbi:DUF6192 family protein [Streptomyces sp. DSM 42041]|uniref:DUF6192 family protein n=1 Tax=Streptomyces hazeniae TaxID=3075538 RepID=A0ABU2NUM7_9ACTN|nr:DUF6192 family protein [Streptomyces sp. DSM 42041]MDT0380212.1 DUF6192 family protein [Streptomyces sp. DSM 42041]
MAKIEVPPGYAREEWLDYVKRGRRIMRTKSASNFEMGDTLNEMLEGRPRGNGEVSRIVSLFADHIRSKESTLNFYRYVARAWPAEMRRLDVPWSVHARLAAVPNRFALIREEPSDELDPQDRGVWHEDAALRARHSIPHSPNTPEERVGQAKRLLRATEDAADAVAQLVDRTEVINRAVENPDFRRAVRDANRDRARRLEESVRAQWPETTDYADGPKLQGHSEERHPEPTTPKVNYRETPTAALKILGQCTSFCVSMQSAVVLIQEEHLSTEELEAVLDSIKKVRAVCDWCEHAVTTGQTDMDEQLVRLLDNGGDDQ